MSCVQALPGLAFLLMFLTKSITAFKFEDKKEVTDDFFFSSNGRLAFNRRMRTVNEILINNERPYRYRLLEIYTETQFKEVQAFIEDLDKRKAKLNVYILFGGYRDGKGTFRWRSGRAFDLNYTISNGFWFHNSGPDQDKIYKKEILAYGQENRWEIVPEVTKDGYVQYPAIFEKEEYIFSDDGEFAIHTFQHPFSIEMEDYDCLESYYHLDECITRKWDPNDCYDPDDETCTAPYPEDHVCYWGEEYDACFKRYQTGRELCPDGYQWATLQNEEKNKRAKRFLQNQKEKLDISKGIRFGAWGNNVTTKVPVGEFYWVSGWTPFAPLKHFWHDNEPNDEGGNATYFAEPCVGFEFRKNSLKWSSMSCDIPGYGLCEKGNVHYSHDGLFTFIPILSTYNDAKTICPPSYQMAEPHNEYFLKEYLMARYIFTTKYSYKFHYGRKDWVGLWIPLTKKNDKWMWESGKSVTHPKWSEGQPGVGDCATLSDENQWNTTSCDETGFIMCERGNYEFSYDGFYMVNKVKHDADFAKIGCRIGMRLAEPHHSEEFNNARKFLGEASIPKNDTVFIGGGRVNGTQNEMGWIEGYPFIKAETPVVDRDNSYNCLAFEWTSHPKKSIYKPCRAGKLRGDKRKCKRPLSAKSQSQEDKLKEGYNIYTVPCEEEGYSLCEQVSVCGDIRYVLSGRFYCFNVSTSLIATFEEARKACESINYHLATIKFKGEIHILLDLMGLYKEDHLYKIYDAWIDLTDMEEDGSYVWGDRWPYIIESWDKGEPRNDTGDLENCVALNIHGKMRVSNCNDRKHVICGKPALGHAVHCLDANDGLDNADPLTENIVLEGEYAIAECKQGYLPIDGQRSRRCLATRELAGKPLRCSLKAQCNESWHPGTDNCYIKYPSRLANYPAMCSRLNAFLVSVKSESERRIVIDILSDEGLNHTFIALKYQEDTKAFVWQYINIQGNVTGWKKYDQKRIQDGEHCVVLDKDGFFDHAHCDHSLTFLCQRPSKGVGVECKNATSGLKNADLLTHGPIKEGQVAEFRCKHDYVPLSGHRKRQCYPDGQLNLNPLVCIFGIVCEDGWKRDGYSCYLKKLNKKTFWAAKQDCENDNAFVVSVTTKNEQNYINDKMGQDTWLNLFDIHKNGTFEWGNGLPLNFTNWEKGQPSKTSKNRCVVMQHNGKWTPSSCEKKLPFMCIKPTRHALHRNISHGETCSTRIFGRKDRNTTRENQDQLTVIEGEFANYICFYGHVAVEGEKQRQCLSNGSLGGSNLVCARGVVCQKGWVQGIRSCYLNLKKKSDYKKANVWCRNKNASIINIMNKEEERIIRDFMRDQNLTDAWLEKKKSGTFTAWAKGHPQRAKPCRKMTSTRQWYSVKCAEKHYIVCEKAGQEFPLARCTKLSSGLEYAEVVTTTKSVIEKTYAEYKCSRLGVKIEGDYSRFCYPDGKLGGKPLKCLRRYG